MKDRIKKIAVPRIKLVEKKTNKTTTKKKTQNTTLRAAFFLSAHKLKLKQMLTERQKKYLRK